MRVDLLQCNLEGLWFFLFFIEKERGQRLTKLNVRGEKTEANETTSPERKETVGKKPSFSFIKCQTECLDEVIFSNSALIKHNSILSELMRAVL